jgi:hypothetical protein
MGVIVKGLIKFLILLVVIFIVSSLFKGGDYVRSISNLTGIDLYSLADTADTMRIDRFMAEKKQTQGEKEKARLGN